MALGAGIGAITGAVLGKAENYILASVKQNISLKGQDTQKKLKTGFIRILS